MEQTLQKKSGTVLLERRFFRTLETGDNEFDYVLSELGYTEEEAATIEEVEVDMAVLIIRRLEE